jgi:hypothetical protein
MSSEVVRLVSGCRTDLLRQMLENVSPERTSFMRWTMKGTSLGKQVVKVYSPDAKAWPLLQHAAALARHDGKAVVRSVIYRDENLRNQLDAMDASNETAAVWLASISEPYFEFALSALNADRGMNKRSWRAYRVTFSAKAEFKFDAEAKAEFECRVREIIAKTPSLDAPGRLSVHHFNRIVFPEHTHSRRDQNQVTIYAEMRNVTEEQFIGSNKIEFRRKMKVDEISVVLDRERRELDVISIGGRDFLKRVAHAFCDSFSTEVPPIDELIRRPVHLEVLTRKPDLSLEGQDVVEHRCIDEIRVRSADGLLITLECKSHGRKSVDVYDLADRRFGERSPFRQEGWQVESARIRLDMMPNKVASGPKVRTVELKRGGRTNLREHEDRDRFIANTLLVSWGLLEPPNDDDD